MNRASLVPESKLLTPPDCAPNATSVGSQAERDSASFSLLGPHGCKYCPVSLSVLGTPSFSFPWAIVLGSQLVSNPVPPGVPPALQASASDCPKTQLLKSLHFKLLLPPYCPVLFQFLSAVTRPFLACSKCTSPASFPTIWDHHTRHNTSTPCSPTSTYSGCAYSVSPDHVLGTLQGAEHTDRGPVRVYSLSEGYRQCGGIYPPMGGRTLGAKITHSNLFQTRGMGWVGGCLLENLS